MVGTIYCLHFPRALAHARHYTGWTEGEDVGPRLQAHLKGKGSPLVKRLCEVNGITDLAGLLACLAYTKRGDRYEERRLKNYGGARRHCAVCRSGGKHGERSEGGEAAAVGAGPDCPAPARSRPGTELATLR